MGVLVKGVGMTKIGRRYENSVEELAAEVVESALNDAGWSRPDVIIASSTVYPRLSGQMDLASYLAAYMGFSGVSAITVDAGEASGLAAVMAASRMAVDGKRVLVVGVDKLSEAPSSVVYKVLKGSYYGRGEGVYPVSHAAIPGLLADLYMSRYGVDRLTLSYWPALMHSNAKDNPYAMLRFAISPESVSEAMPVARPLTMLDAFPLGDGAAAIAVSSTGDGEGMAILAAVESSAGRASIAHRDDPLEIESVSRAWASARMASGVDVIDLLEVHDSYSIMGVLILEALGLTEKGKAAEMVAEGYFAKDGEGPLVNPSGGLKARGHPVGATGVYMVAEVSMQLAGTFPGVSVDNPKSGAAVSINGHGSTAYVSILKSA